MELVMIKLEVCYACELFEPVAKQISEDRNVKKNYESRTKRRKIRLVIKPIQTN